MREIYMDANATTPPAPEVLEAMRPYGAESFGNASSVHQRGQQARAAVEQARESVAGLLHCRSAEIVFTSGGTESDNLALFGAVTAGDHMVTTAIEHHAVLHAADALADRGVEVTYLPPTEAGMAEPDALRAAMRPNTRLVSVMLANNETGVIQPVRELAGIARAAGAVFHTDAIQGAGKMRLDVQELGCDLLSLSAHKMHGPQGIGALFVRRGVKLRPMFFGGLHERGRRPGTENVAGIAGLGKAAELAGGWLDSRATAADTPDSLPGGPQALAAMRDRLQAGILARLARSAVNGTAARVCNTANLYFEGVEAEALIIALDLKGLAVSAGSACQSGATEPSHVLLAMGLGEERARSSVRFSLSRRNTPSDVEVAIEVIAAAVDRLRAIAGQATVR